MYCFANRYCHLLPYFVLCNQQNGAFPSYKVDNITRIAKDHEIRAFP